MKLQKKKPKKPKKPQVLLTLDKKLSIYADQALECDRVIKEARLKSWRNQQLFTWKAWILFT